MMTACSRKKPAFPSRRLRAAALALHAAALAVSALGTVPTVAYAAEPSAVPQNPKIIPIAREGDRATLSRVRLIVNKSETIRIEMPVEDVLVGSSEIADVIPVSDRTLYMLGKKPGTTNVTLFGANKRLVGVIDILVATDVASSEEISRAAEQRARAIEDDIRQATGARGLRVRMQGERAALIGVAPDAITVDRAMQVAPAGTLNLTQVASPQQVMLKVRFIEVNRTAQRELGLRWDRFARNQIGRPASTIGLGRTETSLDPDTGALIRETTGAAIRSAVPFGSILAMFGGFGRGLDLTIDALETKGLVRRLAEPNLIALSGGRAEFQAGGQIPIPISQTSGTAGATPVITVQYKDFGVRLGFTPTVLANGMIGLDLEPEVSDLDPAISVAVGGGLSVPGLTVRRARTSVQMRDGQHFAIAGLLQNIITRNVDQLPWLGSIPIIGVLFSSKQFLSRETELVVIVTPHIVKPAKPGQLMATPLDTTMPANDLDFFASGKLEVRRNMREFVTTNGAAVGPHGHLLPAVVGDQMAPR